MSSIHALDQSANFVFAFFLTIFCGESDFNESLGCSLVVYSTHKSFQLERDFWYWACNFFNCIQQIILFKLFTKCLQHCCDQSWRVRVQQRCLHLRINPMYLPNFLRMLLKEALQGYLYSPTFWEENPLFSVSMHLILIAFF